MQEHPTPQMLKKYNRRTLSPDAFLAIHRHVVSCAVCAEGGRASLPKMEDYVNLLSALTPAPTDEPYHLSSVELMAYTRKELDEIDRENAESHLEVCEECRAKAQPIHRAKKKISTTGVAARASLPTAATRQNTHADATHFFQRRAVQLAALTIVVGAAVLLTILFLRARTDNQTARQTPSQDSNNITNQAPPPSFSQANPPTGQGGVSENGNAESETTAQSPDANALPDASESIVLQLNDGGQKILLDRQGELKGAEHLPPRLQQAIKTTLSTQRLERPPQLSELNGKAGTLLSESGDGLPFQLVGPLGKVVAGNQPTFRWRALAGAESYTVTVTDARLNVVATSNALTGLEWKIPKPLSGGVYSWQVTALKDGQPVTSPVLPAPQAKFRVLEHDKAEELRRARQTLASSHLALGLLLTQAGLLDEAEREFQLLSKANPHSQLPRKLLAQVRAMR
jgi:hypothetical protein